MGKNAPFAIIAAPIWKIRYRITFAKNGNISTWNEVKSSNLKKYKVVVGCTYFFKAKLAQIQPNLAKIDLYLVVTQFSVFGKGKITCKYNV